MNALISALDHLLVRTRHFDADRDNYALLLGGASSAPPAGDTPRRAIYTAGNTRLVLEESADEEGLAGLCFAGDDRERLRRRMQRLGLIDTPTEDISACDDSIDWLRPEASRGLRIGVTATREAISVPAADEGVVTGLDHAVITSAGAEGTAFLLGSQLGLDLRMDLSRPDWDARLLFFRCGDLIIEVFERLSAGAAGDAARDRLYGLSWRVGNADEARRTLAAAGFDVSEVRQGRKPGTRVFTLRDRCAGVATLLLEPPPAA
ncbi:MAG: glyoxalase [Halieaceae bacterium]|jgi:hypothetical protein|nr:glyoxalase [Halieaceae bacterium]